MYYLFGYTIFNKYKNISKCQKNLYFKLFTFWNWGTSKNGSRASRDFPSLTDTTDLYATWRLGRQPRSPFWSVCLKNWGKGEGYFVTVSQHPIEPFTKLVHVNQSPSFSSKRIDLIILDLSLFPSLVSHSGWKPML